MGLLETIFKFLEAIPLIGKVFSTLRGVYLAIKRDWRLFDNLKRPIMVIGSSGKDMGLVVKLIRDAGFFRLEDFVGDTAQSLDRIKKHSIIVVGYTETETETARIIDTARAKSIPVIFYATFNEISKSDGDLILGYSYAEVANTPFRIMNLIFSILSTYKYDK